MELQPLIGDWLDESSGSMILKNNGGGAVELRRLVVFWKEVY